MKLTSIATTFGASVLTLAFAAAPATAAISDSEMVAMRDAMMTKTEAAKVGVSSDLSTFSVTEAKRDTIWLCDLGDSNGAEVDVPAPRKVFAIDYSQDLGAKGVRSVTENVYQYASAKAARASYKALTAKLKTCSGSNTHTENGVSYTQAVSNGAAKVDDGDDVVWMLSESALAGTPGAWASHDYSVFHLDGDVIVNIQLDHDGPAIAAATAAQRKVANELACDAVHRA